MENRDSINTNEFNKEQSSNSITINKIEEKIKNIKKFLRESYKKLKCSNEREQETLNQNL